MSKFKKYPIRFIRTANGIRAQDLRLLNRSSWWSRRWLASLEAMHLGARFGRGRQYALDGQIISLSIEGPHVESLVQGSREDAYKVTLDFTALSDEATGRVGRRLLSEPMLAARILTDDLPLEIEGMLREEGVPLFPAGELSRDENGKRVFDVKMKCSCPDWARPCKHLIALMLLLGDELSRHPMLLLSLRGLDVASLMPEESVSSADEDVSDTLKTDSAFSVSRLGAIPFWRAPVKSTDAIERIFRRVKSVASTAASSESIDLRK